MIKNTENYEKIKRLFKTQKSVSKSQLMQTDFV